jgi:predicted  nucleic acid-binding Zn-ribbon protein
MAKKKEPVMLDAMVRRRCTSCGTMFRTFEADRTVCQNCDGSHNPDAQSQKEAATVRKANTVPNKGPQSYDPRTNLPVETPAEPQDTPDAG